MGGSAPMVRSSVLLIAAALCLLAGEVAFLAMGFAQHQWLTDAAGAPLCRDFSVFWASGRLAAQGLASRAYDWPQVHEVLRAAGQSADCVMPMFYPPKFLLWLAPFGAAPYGWAAAAWIAASLAAYLAAVRLATPRPELILLALAAPAVTACLTVGQNGLFIAALALGGLVLLDRRPLVAGVLLGALAFKPQLGVLLPLVLMAGGRWKTFAAAAATVVVGVAAAGVVFGWDTYPLFLDAIRWAGRNIVNAGAMADFKQQSVHALAGAEGAGPVAAWAWQAAASLAAAAGLVWLWRRDCSASCKAAGLLAGMLAASPYSGVYDFPVFAAAIVMLLADRTARVDRLDGGLLAAAYLAPLLYGSVPIPIGPFVSLLLAAVVARRALGQSGAMSKGRAGDGSRLQPA